MCASGLPQGRAAVSAACLNEDRDNQIGRWRRGAEPVYSMRKQYHLGSEWLSWLEGIWDRELVFHAHSVRSSLSFLLQYTARKVPPHLFPHTWGSFSAVILRRTGMVAQLWWCHCQRRYISPWASCKQVCTLKGGRGDTVPELNMRADGLTAVA